MRRNARIALVLALACLPLPSGRLWAARRRIPTTQTASGSDTRKPALAPSAAHTPHATSSRKAAATKPSAHTRPDRKPEAKSVAAARHTARTQPPPVAHTHATDSAAIDRVHAWVKGHPTAPDPIAARAAIEADDGHTVAAAPQSPAPADLRESGTSHPPDDETAPTHAPDSAATTDETSLLTGPLAAIPTEVALPPGHTIAEQASTPVFLASLYDTRGRLVVPPPLKGSHEILLHQNQVADRDGLKRILNDDDILTLRRAKGLVALPDNAAIRVDERLPANRRYARPWAAQFLTNIAADHYVRFHSPLQVNSAVRTVEFQLRLLRTNGNAAPADGETASPHLTGQAVDIAKKGLTLAEIAWMRAYLLPLVAAGKIDVEEEFQQACFHISVYTKYVPPPPRVNVASAPRAAALTAAIH